MRFVLSLLLACPLIGQSTERVVSIIVPSGEANRFTAAQTVGNDVRVIGTRPANRTPILVFVDPDLCLVDHLRPLIENPPPGLIGVFSSRPPAGADVFGTETGGTLWVLPRRTPICNPMELAPVDNTFGAGVVRPRAVRPAEIDIIEAASRWSNDAAIRVFWVTSGFQKPLPQDPEVFIDPSSSPTGWRAYPNVAVYTIYQLDPLVREAENRWFEMGQAQLSAATGGRAYRTEHAPGETLQQAIANSDSDVVVDFLMTRPLSAKPKVHRVRAGLVRMVPLLFDRPRPVPLPDFYRVIIPATLEPDPACPPTGRPPVAKALYLWLPSDAAPFVPARRRDIEAWASFYDRDQHLRSTRRWPVTYDQGVCFGPLEVPRYAEEVRIVIYDPLKEWLGIARIAAR